MDRCNDVTLRFNITKGRLGATSMTSSVFNKRRRP